MSQKEGSLQDFTSGDVTGGVTTGVTGGVTTGVTGGVTGAAAVAHVDDALAAPKAPLAHEKTAVPVKLVVRLMTLAVLPDAVTPAEPLHVFPVTVHVSV